MIPLHVLTYPVRFVELFFILFLFRTNDNIINCVSPQATRVRRKSYVTCVLYLVFRVFTTGISPESFFFSFFFYRNPSRFDPRTAVLKSPGPHTTALRRRSHTRRDTVNTCKLFFIIYNTVLNWWGGGRGRKTRESYTRWSRAASAGSSLSAVQIRLVVPRAVRLKFTAKSGMDLSFYYGVRFFFFF